MVSKPATRGAETKEKDMKFHKLRKALAAVGLVTAITAGAAAVAEAGTYTSATTCAASYALGNRVCVDIGDNTVTVYDTGTHIYAQGYATGSLVASGPTPTAGWVEDDAYCNFNGTSTVFTTGSAYNLNSQTVTIQGGPAYPHGWNDWPVDNGLANIVAYVANSNSGYQCIIVP